MTRIQFEMGIDKLRKVYGEGKYPEVRTDILFTRFKNIQYSVFTHGIDNLILECKFPPMMEDFRAEFHDAMRTARDERFKSLVKENPCVICNSTGRVSVKAKVGAAYSFRCNCKLGSEMFPNFPEYKAFNR